MLTEKHNVLSVILLTAVWTVVVWLALAWFTPSRSDAKLSINENQRKVSWTVARFTDDAQSISRGVGCSVTPVDRETYARSLGACAPEDDTATCTTRTQLYAAGYTCPATIARNACAQAAADDALTLCPQGQVGQSGTAMSNAMCARLGLAFGVCTLSGDAETCEKDSMAQGFFPPFGDPNIHPLDEGAPCVQDRVKKIIDDWRDKGRAMMQVSSLPDIDKSGNDDED